MFNKSKPKGEEKTEEIFKEVFFDNLCFDEFFEPISETVDVRESVDGIRETLDQLLYRLDRDYTEPKISWETFLEAFTKRGKLRPGEQLIFGPPLRSKEEMIAETQR